ncbi:hypothetical protein X943_001873 [Babesia divergens]|uniref:Uncharacterized protein n=1 Tax=Babesia divergens TaxID=32595 RepID=A0AAD9GFI2_BABDI|nr:hypothetical protein X943_001873 [Babesia divergens]
MPGRTKDKNPFKRNGVKELHRKGLLKRMTRKTNPRRNTGTRSKRKCIIIAVILCILILGAASFVIVYFFLLRNNASKSKHEKYPNDMTYPIRTPEKVNGDIVAPEKRKDLPLDVPSKKVEEEDEEEEEEEEKEKVDKVIIRGPVGRLEKVQKEVKEVEARDGRDPLKAVDEEPSLPGAIVPEDAIELF